jgi:hypothetical protein
MKSTGRLVPHPSLFILEQTKNHSQRKIQRSTKKHNETKRFAEICLDLQRNNHAKKRRVSAEKDTIKRNAEKCKKKCRKVRRFAEGWDIQV